MPASRSEIIESLIKLAIDPKTSPVVREAIEYAIGQFDYAKIAQVTIPLNIGFTKSYVSDDNGNFIPSVWIG